MASSENALQRSLGKIDSTALVIGTIIGTGVFLKTGPMAQALGSAWLVLLAWVVAGFLSLMGALVYAELGGLFPKAGGEFVYLQEAYGPRTAFLYGWQRFWIGNPGSIAAYAVGAGVFLHGAFNISDTSQKLVAVALVIFFTLINCLAVSFGGRVQSFLTALKIVLVVGLAAAALGFSSSGSWQHLAQRDGRIGFSLNSFGLAVIAALWAFDGWNNLPMAAGEVKDPKKTLPFALVWGTIIVLLVYGIANIGYFYSLNISNIIENTSMPLATQSALTFMGSRGVAFLSIAFVISAIGAMNGSILTGARVPYAMAEEGLFPSFFAQVSAKTRVPVTSVLFQGVWSVVLAMSGTFDRLTDWVVFSEWIFYGLCGYSLFVFRKKHKDMERPYSVPFYPILPIIFLGLSVVLLGNSLWSMPKESGLGVLFILSGIPFYGWLRSAQKKKAKK